MSLIPLGDRYTYYFHWPGNDVIATLSYEMIHNDALYPLSLESDDGSMSRRKRLSSSCPLLDLYDPMDY